MRFSLQCGLIEAGLAACISSLCLWPSTARPQHAAAEQVSSEAAAAENLAVANRIARQQELLLSAIERIREESDSAVRRYTAAVLTQVTLVHDDFAAQQAAHIENVVRLERSTQRVVVALLGAAVFSLLILAWLPWWAMRRVSRKLLDVARARGSVSATAHASPELLQLESALTRIERRLLSLETHSPNDDPAIATEHAEDASSGTTAKTPLPQRRAGAAAKSPATPRVVLAVGDSSALIFLPHDAESPKAGRWRRQLARLRRLLVPARTSH